MKKIIATLFVAAGAALVSMSAVQAQVSTPPSTDFPTAGYTLVASLSQPDVLTGYTGTTTNFTADVGEWVYQTIGTNDLTFVYQVQNLDTPAETPIDGLALLTAEGNFGTYGGAETVDGSGSDVGSTGTPGGITAAGNAHFNFTNLDATSNYLVVSTTATRFNSSGAILLQDTGQGNIPAFQPAATPEASSMLPFGFVGMGLLGLIVARRKQVLKAGN